MSHGTSVPVDGRRWNVAAPQPLANTNKAYQWSSAGPIYEAGRGLNATRWLSSQC